MRAEERTRNPFVNSAIGGRALSALQLPFFIVRPPSGYGVLTTTGRRSGKTRRRCVRAIRRGDVVYVVAIKGLTTTGWAQNALVNPDVRLRLPGGTFSGRARRIHGTAENHEAVETYCGTVGWFDYLTWINWRKGRPTRSRIRQLFRSWLEEGALLAIELTAGRGSE